MKESNLYHDWEGTITNYGDGAVATAVLRFWGFDANGVDYTFARYTNQTAGYAPNTQLALMVGENEIHFYDGTGIWRLTYAEDKEDGISLNGKIINPLDEGRPTAHVAFKRRQP